MKNTASNLIDLLCFCWVDEFSSPEQANPGMCTASALPFLWKMFYSGTTGWLKTSLSNVLLISLMFSGLCIA